MSKPIPVEIPILISNLTVAQFLEGNLYGFLEATVTAPANEYIGLLPIKYQGRLICPGGTFKGLFFSEELRFALANGYTLLEITRAFEFREGRNTFLQLITQLNEMKITAQLNKQPTIRNLAKLLMNSMYGRFGMHPSLSQTNIYTEEQLENLAQQWLLLNRIDFGELSLVTTLLNQEWILGNLGRQELIKALIDAGNNTNVAIASAVTAHSRMIINQYKLEALKLGRKLYYSDTDLLVLNGKLPEEFLLFFQADICVAELNHILLHIHFTKFEVVLSLHCLISSGFYNWPHNSLRSFSVVLQFENGGKEGEFFISEKNNYMQ